MATSPLHTPLRLLVLIALCSTTIAMPANRLFARQDSGLAQASVSCPAVLPDNFSCPEGSSCKALAGGTTAVCCPKGSSCDKIKPITCNVGEQDADKHPDAPIKTTIFDVDLETCGSSTCCPFGYSCSGNGECVMDKDQSQAPKGSEPTASKTSAPGATSTGSPASTETSEPTSTLVPASSSVPGKGVDSNPDADKGKSGPATTSIIGGVVAGCFVLLAIAVVIFLYIRRSHRNSGAKSEKSGYGSGARPTSSVSSFGNKISSPIMQNDSWRTDFIRKTPPTMTEASVAPIWSLSTRPRVPPPLGPQIRIDIPEHTESRFSRIPNPFDSPNPSPEAPYSARPSPEDDRPPRHGTVAAARLPPIRTMKSQNGHWNRRPMTPELQRESSSESINVFADPGSVDRSRNLGRRLTHATTFTNMMDEAELGDVRRGAPYVPRTTPRI